MLDRLVRDRELGKVVASHLRLNLNGVEDFAVVDADDGANHLGDDDHIAEVGLDDSRLFIRRGLLLCLAELLDEAHGLALEAPAEPAADAGVDKFDELLVGEVEELVELDTAVGEGAEGAALLELSSNGGVGNVDVSHGVF